jgi:predicted heme/steroid binding protein
MQEHLTFVKTKIQPVSRSASDLISYSPGQLALRNGRDREEIWCAYRGLIYDLARSRLWREGMHYEHWAGQDLTEELKDAPHSDRVFEKFPVIGRLQPL